MLYVVLYAAQHSEAPGPVNGNSVDGVVVVEAEWVRCVSVCVRIRGHMFGSTLFYDPAAENHDEGNPTNYTSFCRQAGNNNNSPSPAHTDCIIKCRLLFPSSHTMAWDHRKAPSSVLRVSNCKRPPDEVLDSLSLAIPYPRFLAIHTLFVLATPTITITILR